MRIPVSLQKAEALQQFLLLLQNHQAVIHRILFYSFPRPKNKTKGEWRPRLIRSIHLETFNMEPLQTIIQMVQPRDWMILVDVCSASPGPYLLQTQAQKAGKHTAINLQSKGNVIFPLQG